MSDFKRVSLITRSDDFTSVSPEIEFQFQANVGGDEEEASSEYELFQCRFVFFKSVTSSMLIISQLQVQC